MTGSAMKLLDLSDHLPGLPRLPGLKKWYARDKIQYYSNWEEASQVCIVHLLICNPVSEHIAAHYVSHMTGTFMLESRCLIKYVVFRSSPCNLVFHRSPSACLHHTFYWLQQMLFAARVLRHAAIEIGQLVFCHVSHVCHLSVLTAWPACNRIH